jgi:hypothetical protein
MNFLSMHSQGTTHIVQSTNFSPHIENLERLGFLLFQMYEGNLKLQMFESTLKFLKCARFCLL